MIMGSTNTINQCEDYTILPIHQHDYLIDKVCMLLNEEWPRSVTARMRTLNASCDEFPACLALVERSRPDCVVGHAKLSPVPDRDDALFVESVVVSRKLRGRGLGRHLMALTEEYATGRGCRQLYLTTYDKQQFYGRLGYALCSPIQTFGGSRRLLRAAGGPAQTAPSSNGLHSMSNGVLDTAARPAQRAAPPPATTAAGTGAPPPPPPPPPSSGKRCSVQKEQPKKDFMMKMMC